MKDTTCEVVRNPKYDGYRGTLPSMVYKCFEKKPRSEVSVNENLAVKLHKTVIKILKRSGIFVSFKDNVWVADLAEMGSLSSKNKNNVDWSWPVKEKITSTLDIQNTKALQKIQSQVIRVERWAFWVI